MAPTPLAVAMAAMVCESVCILSAKLSEKYKGIEGEEDLVVAFLSLAFI